MTIVTQRVFSVLRVATSPVCGGRRRSSATSTKWWRKMWAVTTSFPADQHPGPPTGAAPWTGRRRIVILGSTGSIGTQALDVIAAHPDAFEVVGLAAGGAHPELLAQQAAAHPSAVVAVAGDCRRVDVGRSHGDLRRPGGHRVWSSPSTPTSCSTGSPARSALNPRWPRCGPAGCWHWRTRNRWSPAGAGDRGGGARPARARRLRTQRARPVPERRCAAGGLTAGGDRVRWPVPRADGGANGRGHRRAGARPPDLGDGAGRHHQLGDPGQQGPGGDRGAPAVRHPLRPDRRRRASAVGDPLDGDLRRRVDAGAGQPAGHEAADRTRAGLAAPVGPGGRCLRLRHRSRAGPSSPSIAQAFPALDLAIAAGNAGGTVPAAFNAANEEAVDAFRRGHLRFTGISEVLAGILDGADQLRSNPRDVQDVWATEDWARRRAREIIEAAATGSPSARSLGGTGRVIGHGSNAASRQQQGGGGTLDVDRNWRRAVRARAALLDRLA